ncbi:hypothetical protein H4219_003019 [Mycoemilia scoparia]|uniref:alpha-1,2-Mannosidase n=1 Tax=Mycoemilia scoparia TaxID=417184 RepID=A0A9W8A5D9_9FUNG|nr:hypothetical protein H4219_003019 [Mycoemilia scoparia]
MYEPVPGSSEAGAQAHLFKLRRIFRHAMRSKRAVLLITVCSIILFTVVFYSFHSNTPKPSEIPVFPKHPLADPNPLPDSEDALTKINEKRREDVRVAMMHAWKGYKQQAFGKDEVFPKSGNSNNKWGGWAVTLLDALDTLHIMGLTEDFKEARDYALKIDFNHTVADVPDVTFFEMVIRALGGLLGAYELSNDAQLLMKAKEVGDVLAVGFDTPSGIPYQKVNVNGSKATFSPAVCIADIGSVQLEYQKLSELTKDPSYREKAQKIVDFLDKAKKPYPGLYYTWYSFMEEEFNGIISLGATADSWYEYMIKQYILNGKRIDQYRRMYIEFVESAKQKMIFPLHSDPSMVYAGILSENDLEPVGHFHHLASFIPGMLALGAKELDRPEDLELAKKMMKLCYMLYANSATGLSPELVIFPTNGEKDQHEIKHSFRKLFGYSLETPLDYDQKYGYYTVNTNYGLRPETVESLMYLYRITGDKMYQEWGWNIFQSIQKYTKTTYGYAAYDDVMDTDPSYAQNDQMESFFFAETLKYLYLLFSPKDFISLDEFVFNTEAHPFRKITS